jgi:hypothetical protein
MWTISREETAMVVKGGLDLHDDEKSFQNFGEK